jgi:DNA-binding SARP family transcriptional activator
MDAEPSGPSIVVLGHVGVRHGSVPLTRQDRHLLALLTVHHGRLLGADEIISALWPGVAPPSARNRVQWLISSLRRALPTDAIDSSRSGYRLAVAPGLIDAALFTEMAQSDNPEVLESALGLWHGPAYQEINLPVVALEAQRLNEMRLNVEERLLTSRLEAGQHLSVVPELRRLVAEHPLRQRFRAQLMLALYRAGQQAEALEAYRLGATLLATDHGLDPSPELRRLQRQILRDDPALAGEPVVVAPMQLPPAAPHIVGRGELRGDLTRRLRRQPEQGTATIVALHGMGGVGKTTLATRVGHDVRADFPGGILFADLHGLADQHGVADQAASASTVLNGFLRSLGLSGEAIPPDLPARQALYRSVLDGRRMLLVLDNARDEEQVRPLLPGAGGVALVTSRRLLAGLVDATHTCVEPLDSGGSLELFQQTAGARAGEQPGAAAEITSLCGGLPLAIRIAGIRLREQRSLSATMLRDRLADERQRLD